MTRSKPSSKRRATHASHIDGNQLGLFDQLEAAGPIGTSATPIASTAAARVCIGPSEPTVRAEAKTPPEPLAPTSHTVDIKLPSSKSGAPTQSLAARIVTEDDLPSYSPALVELVERSLTMLPSDRVWFTYCDVRAAFGVSRATVARRLKDGLVPGIRITDGRVLEDGSVRRFDRRQLRFLLLAIRERGKSAGAVAIKPEGSVEFAQV